MPSKPRARSKARSKSNPKSAKGKTKTKTKAKAQAGRPRRPAARAAAGQRPEVPHGYRSVTAYLIAQDATAAIAFYQHVFGAREVLRMPAPGGKIGHAELEIGDSKIMLADEFPGMNARGPRHYQGSPVTIMVYVKNVDTVVARAVAKGAKLLHPVKDQFYGDRTGNIEDPEGHIWHVATRVEEVPPKELKRRVAAMMAQSKTAS